ncbi:Chitooligosaccharidolytic beta-N-acetylglucosaminidase [Olea europaea subsp. europaea]|uniref:Beta-hexosaminidase n=1 Tax=Olea europaea subsp. europaea TaxID=158383 RepID=A0A8S0TFP7_OLEEU|nr:Chitooligosaccharidolytic beta-N-acetylglucosaminidase [Olea europaea subsp. europaea]
MQRAAMLAALALALLLQSALTSALESNTVRAAADEPIWGYQCVKERCERVLVHDAEGRARAVQALSVCKLTCGTSANLWPRPRHLHTSKTLDWVNYSSINVETRGDDGSDYRNHRGGSLLQQASELFREQQMRKATIKDGTPLVKTGGKTLEVTVSLRDPGRHQLTLNTDEGYELFVKIMSDGRINTTIIADNFFGARHALETLNQLIVLDDLEKQLRLPREVTIRDSPAFPYRGVLLDTSRNFVSVDAIKRTLDAMAASKLNTFHWHITDSHSFPFVSQSFPKFHLYGAYTPAEVYTPTEVVDVVAYGRVRGVRVLPELDAPAHVGEGWQWVGDNATVCVKAEPWQKYCVEPPCGQLNPTVDKVYDLLGGLYHDMLSLFKPDMFHMGGDEVNFNCWNNTDSIVEWMVKKNLSGRQEDDFRMVWDHFQKRAYEKLVEANHGHELPVVIWTSGLTAPGKVDRYLDPKKYIIQIWTKGDDPLIKELAEKKYRLIFSNYEALYFDCGFGAWVGEGNNWCSPYIGWQKVYDNDLKKLLRNLGVEPDQTSVLGAEATLWTEQADSHSVDGRLWPRAAAMAERLWSDPVTGWQAAEYRMVSHRERLVKLGVQADSLQPQWCHQNEGYCYLSHNIQGEH